MAAALTKAATRKLLARSIAALSAEEKHSESVAVQDTVRRMLAELNARCVSVYVAQPQREIDTQQLLEALLRRDGGDAPRVVVPFVEEGGGMEMVELTSPSDVALHCPPNRWGIREPSADFARQHRVDPRDIDVVLVPGMGFTAAGKRIGRGAGYYDAYLKRMSPDAVKIGVALSVQLLPDLPTDEHDVRVDRVVTSSQVY